MLIFTKSTWDPMFTSLKTSMSFDKRLEAAEKYTETDGFANMKVYK